MNQDELESPGRPELVVKGDAYLLTWPCGIKAEVERIDEHSDELKAEVTIYSERPPRPGLLHSAKQNLMSTRSRRELANALEARDPDLDWADLVEAMCFLVRERYRAGEPSIDLRTHVRSPLGRWLHEPFLERDGPTILFADGGTGKSMAAIAIAIDIASGSEILGRLHAEPGPVMYLDWETDADTVQERVDATLAGAELRERPAIHYRRMSSSLMEAAPNLRREIAELGVRAVVVDPLGNARGGEPESADVTIRLFNAARSLGVPWLGVDHVSKSSGNDSTRPFGSTYTHNGARVTWSLDKAQDEGAAAMVVSLTNHKRNNGPKLARLGYRIEFEIGEEEQLLAVRYHRADLATSALASKLPIKQRIRAELLREPMTIKDLADALDAPIRVVSARAGEMRRAHPPELVQLADERLMVMHRPPDQGRLLSAGAD